MRLKKKSGQPDKEGLAAQYKEMEGYVAKTPIFDGRGSGVDVYTCKDCGERFYTQYVDKGVTPFTVACRKCGGIAVHDNTIRYSEWKFLEFTGAVLHSWMRPNLEQFLKLRPAAQEHVLKGGLMLREELESLCSTPVEDVKAVVGRLMEEGWKENPILVPQDRVESFRKTASDLGIPVLVEGVWRKEKEN